MKWTIFPDYDITGDHLMRRHEYIKADRWNEYEKTGLDEEITRLLPDLDELSKKAIEDDAGRYGLEPIPWEHLKQFQLYLKGFYFHSQRYLKEAMRYYTDSLKVSGPNESVNMIRLVCLESIERIITFKKMYDEANLVEWSKKGDIYFMLSHHYIERKSVVLIVDSEFGRMRELANENVLKVLDNLKDQDDFAYISLGRNMDCLQLEKRERNTAMKQTFLKKMGRSSAARDPSKGTRLSSALFQAFEWQSSKIVDERMVVRDHVYYGPHKWIICLLGSDDFNVKDFIESHEKKIKTTNKERNNLTISILALSNQELNHHSGDYQRVADLTKRGKYLNIVKSKDSEDDDRRKAKQFFSAMDVYPSRQQAVIKELF